MKLVDYNVYNSLKFFRESDLTEYEETIEQYFVANITESLDRELMPGGRQIKVTNENKEEFIRLKTNFVSYLCVKAQLEKLCQGFYSVIPFKWVEYLNADELEAFMCGAS